MRAAEYKARVFIATIVILLLAGACVDASSDDDAKLVEKIKAKLLFHDNVNAMRTKISVKDGTVTLWGEADSQAQKELTEVYIDDIKGVKDVDNYMTVKADPKNRQDDL